MSVGRPYAQNVALLHAQTLSDTCSKRSLNPGEVMTVLRHPLSGALYTLRDDGLVEVENNGRKGLFAADGRFHGGDLRQADPHMLLWLAGPQLPSGSNERRNRA